MNKLAMSTCVNVDTAMYYARVIIFDFEKDGRGLFFFTKSMIHA